MEGQTPYQAGKPAKEKLIKVKMTKTILFLYEHELVRLLARDPALWREAIRRGKFALRQRR